ncbi:MAG: hypothetical protein AB8G22_22845 [Saprospiraceae bacterium]
MKINLTNIMISWFRMKVDVWGQSILIVAVLLLLFFASGNTWSKATLAILFIWQIASAAHLLYAYRHVKRLNYLRTTLVIGVSLPIWFYLLGNWSFVPVGGLVIWYFVQTIRDAIIVYRRPISFWDLG